MPSACEARTASSQEVESMASARVAGRPTSASRRASVLALLVHAWSCTLSATGSLRKFRRRDDHQVTSDNLTRDEAATRSALITVASYQVDLDLTCGDATFDSVSVVRFGCAAPGSSTFINLTAPTVREITLNDMPVGLDAFDGNRITLTGLAADNVLRVAADCAYSR